MPEICRISELSIQMIFKDHDSPHLHIYRHRTMLAIILFDGTVRQGYLETDKLKKIRQWLQNHQDELSVNWQRAKNAEKLERIDT